MSDATGNVIEMGRISTVTEGLATEHDWCLVIQFKDAASLMQALREHTVKFTVFENVPA